MQFHLANSPFNQEQTDLLNRLLPQLTKDQHMWLGGYIAGLYYTTEAQLTGKTSVSKQITVLFGSQTGNAAMLAKKFSLSLEAQNFQVALMPMNEFKPSDFKKVSNLLIVTSTHGEGTPPDNAISFHEFLHSKRAAPSEQLKYSVLSLGDSSYEFFCKTGKDFDLRLEQLGGQRLCPRVDCDLDYEELAAGWFAEVLSSLNSFNGTENSGSSSSSSSSRSIEAKQAAVFSETGNAVYSRANPFPADVLENLNLNGRGSQRETRHLEISLHGSHLKYEPGDCLGIYPENHPELVDKLIETMGWNPDERIDASKNSEAIPLREALLKRYELTVLTKPLLEKAAQFSANAKLHELLKQESEQLLKTYLKGRDLLDLVQDYAPWGASAAEFVSILRKMPARLYSIASSLKATTDEVHVAIRAVRYETHGRMRYGVCSVQSSERVQAGDSLPVFIQENANFKLPSNPDVPIIMIGPGTGVAPFRAFMQEREEEGIKGKTWLFYGDQHFTSDFLYQVEWQKWLKDGVLARMDVAFSRDGEQKVYVQHRMLENSRDIYRWLVEGANIYVCGDEKNMAHDVHTALTAILEQEGGMDGEQAAAYLRDLQNQKRYQRDVY